jgi:hypothetical protein
LGRWIDIKRNFREIAFLYYFETIQKSRNPGFAEEPKTTWFTVNPLTSNCNYITGPGSAIKGSGSQINFNFFIVGSARLL